MSKRANALRAVILLLMSVAGVAFGLLAVLAATKLADPRLAAAAWGIVLLAFGADGVAGALVADWPRVGWTAPPDRPTIPAGRLSSLGFGLVIGSVGMLMLLIGLDRMPPPARLAAGVVAAVGLVLGLAGQSRDRRCEVARGGPDAEPPTAIDPAR